MTLSVVLNRHVLFLGMLITETKDGRLGIGIEIKKGNWAAFES